MNKQSVFNSIIFLISLFLLLGFILYVKYNPSLKKAEITMDFNISTTDKFVYVDVLVANTGSGMLRNGTLSIYPPQGFDIVVDDEGTGHLDKYVVELTSDQSLIYQFKLSLGDTENLGSKGTVSLTTPDKSVMESRDFGINIGVSDR